MTRAERKPTPAQVQAVRRLGGPFRSARRRADGVVELDVLDAFAGLRERREVLPDGRDRKPEARS